jgi:hypothetical protein
MNACYFCGIVGLFTELAPEQESGWWSPPIYRHAIHVTEKSAVRLFAKATDLVIGGGLLSWFMRLAGGDQDYDYLSCGYASADIAPWRPTLSGRKRASQYMHADRDFVRRALSPGKQFP